MSRRRVSDPNLLFPMGPVMFPILINPDCGIWFDRQRQCLRVWNFGKELFVPVSETQIEALVFGLEVVCEAMRQPREHESNL